ncbi:hypothetical protein CL618_00020 [archaeon]|nr:hypothetical protein [archaeon]|tara:strand:+ start:288 stop:914 length:627 start_codon:yes stop_codon:yes gene_type:complete
MKKLILFDLDGTLVNSDRTHLVAFKKAFEKNELKIEDKKVLDLFGMLRRKIVKKLFRLNDKKVLEVVKDQDDFVVKETNKYSKVLKGVKKSLKVLKKKYKLGIVSNSSKREINSLLKGSGLDKKLFSVIVGSDGLRGKPYADGIRKAEKILKRKCEWFIGDTSYDVVAGKRGKCKTIGVLSGNHSKKQLEKVKPDFIVKDVSKLVRIL